MNIQVLGAQVHDAEQGSGPPVLFLHGNPDSSIMWEALIAGMKARFRCIAPDLPGFGHSEVPANLDVSLEGMAKWIDEVVRGLKLSEPLNLVAHDFGATFGLAWAIRHSEKVRRIAVSNVNFFSDYKWHTFAKMFRTPLLGEFLQATTTRGGFRMGMKAGGPKLTNEHIDRTFDLYPWRARKMALRLYRAIDPNDFKGWEDDLLKLTARVPTEVFWGNRDPYAPSSLAERFGARQVHHFADCGHWVFIEAADRCIDQLTALFA
jgi:pimeloyl-ACP methyl ester carboxylesterase